VGVADILFYSGVGLRIIGKKPLECKPKNPGGQILWFMGRESLLTGKGKGEIIKVWPIFEKNEFLMLCRPFPINWATHSHHVKL
jgi:hypothetical protein